MNLSGVRTSNTRKLNPERLKPSNKYLTEALGRNWAIVVVWVAVLSMTLPVFRSGGRSGLTFWGWIINHSVFGKPVEYVPIENYLEELEGAWTDEEGLHW